jgi:hypothetical protein
MIGAHRTSVTLALQKLSEEGRIARKGRRLALLGTLRTTSATRRGHWQPNDPESSAALSGSVGSDSETLRSPIGADQPRAQPTAATCSRSTMPPASATQSGASRRWSTSSTLPATPPPPNAWPTTSTRGDRRFHSPPPGTWGPANLQQHRDGYPTPRGCCSCLDAIAGQRLFRPDVALSPFVEAAAFGPTLSRSAIRRLDSGSHRPPSGLPDARWGLAGGVPQA